MEDLGFLKEHLRYHTAKFDRRLLSKLGMLYMEEDIMFKASVPAMIRVLFVEDLLKFLHPGHLPSLQL